MKLLSLKNHDEYVERLSTPNWENMLSEMKEWGEILSLILSLQPRAIDFIEKVKSENIALANKLEAYEIKERQNAKKELIEAKQEQKTAKKE